MSFALPSLSARACSRRSSSASRSSASKSRSDSLSSISTVKHNPEPRVGGHGRHSSGGHPPESRHAALVATDPAEPSPAGRRHVAPRPHRRGVRDRHPCTGTVQFGAVRRVWGSGKFPPTREAVPWFSGNPIHIVENMSGTPRTRKGPMNLSGRGRRSRSSANRAARSVVIAIAVTSLAACSSGHSDVRRADSGTSPAASKPTKANSDPTTPAEGGGDPILVKTSMNGLTGRGKVVTGSVLGESAFCAHGTVRHDQGSPEIGFPAVNVFSCPGGQLKIGFGPGPEQMSNSVQTSDWKVLEGSGRFTGMTGSGQMIVQWSEKAGSEKGHETFTGRVLAP